MDTNLIIILAVVGVVLLIAISIYNKLVRSRNLVHEGWSGIETQLKRRADLIPNIVETVKGYATHEKGTFEEVTRLRTASQGGATTIEERAAMERQISSMIGKIMAVAEAYPELKADANFRDLQNKLAEVEEQINLSRRYYNGTARNYNDLVQTVPSNIIAGLTGFKTAQYFEIDDPADRAAPKVKFG